MRFTRLAFVAALVATSASAQQTDSSIASDPVYFLIDASGSMARGANWGDVEDIVSRRAAAILKGDPTTQFSFNRVAGGAQNCKTLVTIAPPTPFSTPTLEFPNQDSSTLLGTALQTVVDSVRDGAARVIIVTDGSEQCGPSVCEVAQATLPSHNNIHVEILFTEDALPTDKVRLGCVASAQSDALEIAGESPKATSQTEVAGAAGTEKQTFNALHVALWASIVLLVLLVMTHASAATYLYSVRGVIKERQNRQHMSETQKSTATQASLMDESDEKRAQRAAREKANEERRLRDDRENRKTLTPVATWMTGWLSGPNIVLILAIVVMIGADQERDKFFDEFRDFVGSNIGAGLVCSVLVAAFGWLLVQFWQITDAKNKTRDYQVDLMKAEQSRGFEAIRRYKANILEWRIERPSTSSYKWLPVRAKREDKVDQIKRQLLQISSKVDDEVFLEQTNRDMRTDRYSDIAARLIERAKISPEARAALVPLLSASSSELLTSLRQTLEDFEINTMERA